MNDTRYMKVETILREAPVEDFHVISGDAVHNIRVSLDLLANSLFRRAGGQIRKPDGKYEQLAFPFSKSQDTLGEQIKKSKFHKAGPAAVQLLKQLAPYPGGNERLAWLHELDIVHKHRMLAPVLAHLKAPTGAIALPLSRDTRPSSLMSGTYLISREIPGSDATGDNLPVSIGFMFPPMGPFDSQPVIAALRDLHSYVLGVVQQFAELPNDGTVPSVG
ncbi:hypothetical protein [Bosea sp. 685]|uniref:hypothetical protein n=1 Tax=Bosea sp. 685 TaxID=3080057 RepID=UPI0028937057|nr:hypothetical protein [Bosea sp. 685]WNJ89183.1 hypothetical protein RMR04_22595 [Bosea sp. 685]